MNSCYDIHSHPLIRRFLDLDLHRRSFSCARSSSNFIQSYINGMGTEYRNPLVEITPFSGIFEIFLVLLRILWIKDQSRSIDAFCEALAGPCKASIPFSCFLHHFRQAIRVSVCPASHRILIKCPTLTADVPCSMEVATMR